jgi:hypothetical protein
MALINRPMYEHFGARHLGVKGPGALTQLEEGVMGVLPLDMSSDPAYWFIQGIRTFGQDKYVAAGGAATHTKVGLSIEDTSAEILIKILMINIIYPNANVNLNRCVRTVFSSDPGEYGVGTDTRIPEAQPSEGIIISSNDNTQPGSTIGSLDNVLNPSMDTNQVPLIISPGESIYLFSETANTAMKVGFIWAEIPAYRAEL